MPAPKAGAIDQTRRLGGNLERVARIELANIPWQGIRLPLHHTRMVHREGIEPPSLPCKSKALPLDERRDVVAGSRIARLTAAYETAEILFL